MEEIQSFLTVPEAAKVLRLGRSAAYELALRYERTGGAEGLPVIRMGRLLRVPRARLEALAGGPLIEPAPSRPAKSARRHHGRPPQSVHQPSLPLD